MIDLCLGTSRWQTDHNLGSRGKVNWGIKRFHFLSHLHWRQALTEQSARRITGKISIHSLRPRTESWVTKVTHTSALTPSYLYSFHSVSSIKKKKPTLIWQYIWPWSILMKMCWAGLCSLRPWIFKGTYDLFFFFFRTNSQFWNSRLQTSYIILAKTFGIRDIYYSLKPFILTSQFIFLLCNAAPDWSD